MAYELTGIPNKKVLITDELIIQPINKSFYEEVDLGLVEFRGIVGSNYNVFNQVKLVRIGNVVSLFIFKTNTVGDVPTVNTDFSTDAIIPAPYMPTRGEVFGVVGYKSITTNAFVCVSVNVRTDRSIQIRLFNTTIFQDFTSLSQWGMPNQACINYYLD